MSARCLLWGPGRWMWSVGGPVALGLSTCDVLRHGGKLAGSSLGLSCGEDKGYGVCTWRRV